MGEGRVEQARAAGHEFQIGLARALGGAILFALPLLMTMEMWTLGTTMGEARLALFLGLMLPVLGGLAYYAGFEESFGWRDLVLNALVAYAVGFVAAAAVLLLLGVLGPALSGAIELAQRYVLDERISTVHDVIANSIGATIGVLVAVVIRAVVKARDENVIARHEALLRASAAG